MIYSQLQVTGLHIVNYKFLTKYFVNAIFDIHHHDCLKIVFDKRCFCVLNANMTKRFLSASSSDV